VSWNLANLAEGVPAAAHLCYRLPNVSGEVGIEVGDVGDAAGDLDDDHRATDLELGLSPFGQLRGEVAPLLAELQRDPTSFADMDGDDDGRRLADEVGVADVAADRCPLDVAEQPSMAR
jgi:hypothetical protein